MLKNSKWLHYLSLINTKSFNLLRIGNCHMCLVPCKSYDNTLSPTRARGYKQSCPVLPAVYTSVISLNSISNKCFLSSSKAVFGLRANDNHINIAYKLSSSRFFSTKMEGEVIEKVDQSDAGIDGNMEKVSEVRPTVEDGRISEEELHILPPTSVQGMKKLDKVMFNKTVSTFGIYVPLKIYGHLPKIMKDQIFPLKKRKCVQNPGEILVKDDVKFKLLLFNPDKVRSPSDLKEKYREIFKQHEVDLTTGELFDVQLTFDSWQFSDIFKVVLPSDVPLISGYTIAGNLAHLNLRKEHEEYKYIIGEVLLDKHNYIKTVVNKKDSINNVYRNFQLELLAGEENYVQTVKVDGFLFKLDFSKVYWNTRLGTEHERMRDKMVKGDILYDVFAGVGPFAIRAAKKGVDVFANDLNPDSYKSLVENVPLNKIKRKVNCSNLDGRDFLKTVVKKDLQARWSMMGKTTDAAHPNIFITMNLPAIALEFLDCFVGLMSDMEVSGETSIPGNLLPQVYCYCFSKEENPEHDIQQRVEQVLGDLTPKLDLRMVRNVAPSKDMWCVHFQLTEHLLRHGSESIENTDDKDPEKKRQKLHDKEDT